HTAAYHAEVVIGEGSSVCTNTTVTVNVNYTTQHSKPAITSSGDLSFCEGGSVTLSATAGFDYYQWTRDGDVLNISSSSLTVTKNSGTYRVQVSDTPFGAASGTYCASEPSSGVKVTVYNDPDISLSSNVNGFGELGDGDVLEICSSSDAAYLRASAGGYPVTWLRDGVVIESADNSNATYSYVYPTVSGVYVATIAIGNTSLSCTFSSAELTVEYNEQPDPVTIATPAVTEFCAGEVNAVLTADAGGSFYKWYKNEIPITDGTGTSNTLTVTEGGDYQVTVANTLGCESKLSNVIEIVSTSIPDTSIGLEEESTDCATGDLTLRVSSTSSKYNYQMILTASGQAIGSSFTGNSSGHVFVTLSGLTEASELGVEVSYADGTGCVGTDMYVGTVAPNSVVLELDGNTLIANIYGEYLEYTWYRNGVKLRNVTGTSLRITDAATYSIEVKFVGGCTITSNSIELGTSDGRTQVSSSERISASTYPNPSQDMINIDLSGSKFGGYKVQIMTLSGQVLINNSFKVESNSHVEAVDIKHLDPGLYNMTISIGNQVENMRIVKQ
ncbi:MAG: T9SS type A sorting domain-containing protein, partial [Marinoscillum sp.]